MIILKYIKYYLGFKSIVETGGKFYIVKGLFFKEALDKDRDYWWYSRACWGHYCSFDSYEEAQRTINLYKVKVL